MVKIYAANGVNNYNAAGSTAVNISIDTIVLLNCETNMLGSCSRFKEGYSQCVVLPVLLGTWWRTLRIMFVVFVTPVN